NETDFWEDFANNFATDLAPIISLFGEQVTKQFLSESTTILDTIVFAVGPLGILTAIVSCIRVCGGPFLRSIVGRAREPHGLPEIELCSSTSDHVCELWSNGGICRVFGRPKLSGFILEFFHHNPKHSWEFYIPPAPTMIESDVPPPCGISIIRDKLDHSHSRAPSTTGSRHVLGFDNVDIAGVAGEWKAIPVKEALRAPFAQRLRRWTRNPNSKSEPQAGSLDIEKNSTSAYNHRGNTSTEEGQNHSPFPNLALNIGVQRSSQSVLNLWLAAIFGVLLQSSFFAYATWATWYHPGFYKGEKASNTAVFFTLTVVGTASVVAGMALCASLVDSNSKERRFVCSQPNSTESASDPETVDSRLFWLQPGGQRIGDQEFQAFAYDEAKVDYITSWKRGTDKTTPCLLVYLAVGLTFIGWVIQFIGLRGQHSTISLYQLCCTVIMSIVRAFIRSYRHTPANKLEPFGKEIEGHELDWQSLWLIQGLPSDEGQINRQPKSNRDETYWTIGSPQPKPRRVEMSDHEECKIFDGRNTMAVILFTLERRHQIIRSLEIDKLATLVNNGEKWPNEAAQWLRIRSRLAYLTNQPPYPAWDVELREVAFQLKRCLQKAVEVLSAGKHFKGAVGGEICGVLWPAVCQMWEAYPDSPEPKGMQVCFQMTRASEGWNIDENYLEAALGLWSWTLETMLRRRKKDSNARFRDIRRKSTAVSAQRSETFSLLLGYWGLHVSESDVPDTQPIRPTSLSIPIITYQHLGHRHPISEDPAASLGVTDNSSAAVILSTEATSSMLHLMAQDIFTVFIQSVGLILQDNLFDIIIRKEKAASHRNVSLVEDLAETLVSEGLATRNEAIMSIIPGLSASQELTHVALIAQANFLKRRKEFSVSERLIEHVLKTSSPGLKPRALKCLSGVYRSEFREMVHQRINFSRQDCLERKNAMAHRLMQSNDVWKLEHVYRDVIDWLLLYIRPTTASSRDTEFSKGPHETHQALPRLDDAVLDDAALDKLGLDQLCPEEALKLALILCEQFDFAESSVDVRKQLLRWAIELDCTELIEYLWAVEPIRTSGRAAFSRGFDEIFWAWNLRTADNDMINTIIFLAHIAEVPVSTPFQLQEEMRQKWWATSQQREVITKGYGQFDRILIAIASDPDGFEVSQLLVDGATARDLTTRDYEEAAMAGLHFGSLETMDLLLSRISGKGGKYSRSESEWADRILLAAKWGFMSYLKRLFYDLEWLQQDKQLVPILEGALELAKTGLQGDNERRAAELPQLDREAAILFLQEELNKARSAPAGTQEGTL
ncbi:hypothetical protein FALBO_236, partial [Fusarium albosuccineum]